MSELQQKREKTEQLVRLVFGTIAITSLAVTTLMIVLADQSPFLELAAMCFAFCMPLSVMLATRPRDGNCYKVLSALTVLIIFYVGVASIFFHVGLAVGIVFLVSTLAALVFRVQKAEAVLW